MNDSFPPERGRPWPGEKNDGLGARRAVPVDKLSASYGFRKEPIAGVRHNGRDAPIPYLPASFDRGGLVVLAN
jgi:hypothetical protein